MAPQLSVVNVSHQYPNGIQALNNVSFEAHAGEFLVVIGLSGSGKSTLLRTVNRLIEPSGGDIIFDGKTVTRIKGEQLREHRKQIGMIFQQFNLVARKTVLENVLCGDLASTPTFASIIQKFTPEQRDRAMHNLEIVGIADRHNNRADALSGGQQQRVAIARALMQQPSMLLADEPVASLDPSTSHSVMKYLQKVNTEFGTTLICNLHFLSLVREYATRVIALKKGELVFSGSPQEITQEWFTTIYGDDAIEVEIR